MVEIIDAFKIVVQKMGSADVEELLKAAALLAEQDYVGSAGFGDRKAGRSCRQSGLAKGVKAGSIIKAAAKAMGGGRERQAGSGPGWRAGCGEAGRGPGCGEGGDEGRGVRPLS